jgi:hypothetical protein
MSKYLQYYIGAQRGLTSGSSDFFSLYVAPNASSPTFRIYKQGSTPPVFSPMVLVTSGPNPLGVPNTYGIPNTQFAAGPTSIQQVYIIEYKDENIQKILAKVVLNLNTSSGCYPGHDSLFVTPPQKNNEQIIIHSSISQLYINHSFFAGGTQSYIPRRLSLNGGSNYLNVSPSSGADSYDNILTDADLAALGIVTNIGTLLLKRESNNCTQNIAEDVKIFQIPIINHTKIDCTSFSSNNGTITLSIANGSGLYTYSWADGSTTQNRTGLDAGTYTVTVMDTDTGLRVSKTITINEPPPLVASYIKTNVTTYSGSDGSITLTVGGGFGTKTFLWNDAVTTQNRSNIEAGLYNVQVSDLSTGEVVNLFIEITEPAPPTFNATYIKSDVTTYGGVNGTIDVTVLDGAGPFTYLWNDGATSQDRLGVAAGFYSVTITDTGTLLTRTLEIIIFQPNPPLPEVEFGDFLQVPLLNSITFIIEEEVDDINVLQTLDNTLFCNQYFPGFEQGNYLQKVSKYDPIVVQINSSFENHSMVLKDYKTNTLIKAFSVLLKEQNIGVAEDYSINIKNHTGFVGQSRVYFSSGDITVPIVAGETFEVLNNNEFNGEYAVVKVEYDSNLGVSYLVINAPYVPSISSVSAVGRFISTYENFNVLESVIQLFDIPDGEYYLELVASSNLGNSKTATSEPIDLKQTHPDTIMIDYWNVDNTFDITWTTGYKGRVRIEGIIGHKRYPGGERSLSRDADFSLVKVNAKKQRILLLETFKLTPYLHEKLSCIFDLDIWKVNNIQYQASDGYAEPEYVFKSKVANSSIRVEQVGWFNKYNSHDIGTVNDNSGLLDVGNGESVLGL